MSRTCEATHSISTRWLKNNDYLLPRRWRCGSIQWSCSGQNTGSVDFEVDTTFSNSQIRFKYTQTDNWSGRKSDLNYVVQLEAIPCNYGGVRYWFRCPIVRNGSSCNSRVGVLYISGKYFGCRKCHRLLYKCQTKSKHGGRTGAVMAYLDLSWGLEEREAKIRTKHWKGRPTKRYKRFLQHIEGSRGRLNWIANTLGSTHP